MKPRIGVNPNGLKQGAELVVGVVSGVVIGVVSGTVVSGTVVSGVVSGVVVVVSVSGYCSLSHWTTFSRCKSFH